MARLFTAIEIPAPISLQLARWQPRKTDGVRLVSLNQIHLTLHFLGDVNQQTYQNALEIVSSPNITLTIDRLGCFPTANQTTTLWAGLQVNQHLSTLQRQMATRLIEVGYHPEIRPYHPHITLARCDKKVPVMIINEFLQQQVNFAPLTFTVEEVVLFSSQLKPNGPEYQREKVYPLREVVSHTPEEHAKCLP